MDKVVFIPEDNTYVFSCPHCLNNIQVKQDEVNCSIFRHGVYRNNFEPIPPHSSRETCDQLYSNGIIYGCGKPFQLFKNETGIVTDVRICDYI